MHKVNEATKKFLYMACVFIIWETASRAVNKTLFLPSPEVTFGIIKTMFETGAIYGHAGASFLRVTIGMVITAMIAIPVGFLISWNKHASRILGPIVSSFHYIPVTCFSPMLILLFGIEEKMKIILLVIAGVFSFLPSVISIASEPNTELKETSYTTGFSYLEMLRRCLIPYIAPQLAESFISLYGVGWTYVIIAEANNARYGLGHLMYIGAARGKTEMVYASIVIIVVISYVFAKICTCITRKAHKWYYV